MMNQEFPLIKIQPFHSLRDKLAVLLNVHLEQLDSKKSNYNKKVLDLCHIGKFLILLNDNYSIVEVRENPDFIVSNSFLKIGIEHEIIVDPEYKKQEGSIKQIFQQAEIAFGIKFPGKDFLVNIFTKENFPVFRKNQTSAVIEDLNNLIANYLEHGILPENNFIEDIFYMPHDRLDFEPNMGAWVQSTLSEAKLNEAIEKKDKRLQTYIKNTGLNEQWLVMVIGSMGKSSFQMNDKMKTGIDSGFSRIYLMEDFKAKLSRLK
jgi:hypothetical protein